MQWRGRSVSRDKDESAIGVEYLEILLEILEYSRF